MTVNRYCTPEWLASSAAGYEQNPRFRQELAKLNVKLSLKINAEPAWGIEEDIIFWAHIDHGELRELAFVRPEEAFQESDFVLAATPQEWKKLLRKESKFVADFMLGRVALEQGSKVGVLSVAPHSNTFIDALTQDQLQFPDEMTAEELAAYREYVQQFRAELGV
jgi:hypothetical protein